MDGQVRSRLFEFFSAYRHCPVRRRQPPLPRGAWARQGAKAQALEAQRRANLHLRRQGIPRVTMKAPSAEPNVATIIDAELLHRVQRQNQEQIIGTLLHDLRNPVHSMRITVELLVGSRRRTPTPPRYWRGRRGMSGRRSRRSTALTRQADRLSTYLGPPRPPAAEPIAVNDWLAEVATLLRESTRNGCEVRINAGQSGQPRRRPAEIEPRVVALVSEQCGRSRAVERARD